MTDKIENKMGKIRLIGIDKRFHTAPVFVTPKLNEAIPEFIVGKKTYKAKKVKEGDVDVYVVDDPKCPVQFSSNDSFQIGHTKSFDRSTPVDLFIFEVALDSTYVAATKADVNPQYHRYYVEDLEEESIEEIRKADLFIDAANIVKSLNGYEDMVDFARIIALGNGKMSPNQVHAALMKGAREQPKLIIEAWNDGSRKHKAFLRKLVEKGTLTMKAGTYYYNKEVIGVNEEFAVEFLKDQKNNALITQWAATLKREKQEKEEKAVELSK